MAIDCQNIKHTYCCVRGLRTQILKIKGKKKSSGFNNQPSNGPKFNLQPSKRMNFCCKPSNKQLSINRQSVGRLKEVLQDTPPLETLKKNTDNRHVVLTLGERSNLKKKHYHKGEKKTGGLPHSNKTENTQSLNTDYEKKVVKFLSGVGQNIKTFPRTWEKPADYLKHLQVLKKTIFHLSRAWDEYQALFIEIRGTFSYVIKSFFSMIVGHPCYDIVPVASNLIQARFRTHKIQEKK